MTKNPQLLQLENEIGLGRREISSDGYSMSLGELTNLYREGELIIRPAFQRLYRWDNEQKSKLIESVLLGIPLPSIFVAQDEQGRWEVVDGLQRISTILQLQGLLEINGEKYEPLTLQATKFLPALEGVRWEAPEGELSLTSAQQLDVKRSKIDVKIIKRGSSGQARYDLFQRLNSYGSKLTAQEIRSATLVSVSPAFQTWIEGLAKHPGFANTVSLSDVEIEQQYDLELVLRFLVLHSRAEISQTSLRNLPDLLDDESVQLASLFPLSEGELERRFTETFDVVASGGVDVFRKWDATKQRFVRGFLNTAFEVIAMGLGFHVAAHTPYRTDVLVAAQELWARDDMATRFATGLSTEARLARMLPIGRELMAA
jgi:hypothetical protein